MNKNLIITLLTLTLFVRSGIGQDTIPQNQLSKKAGFIASGVLLTAGVITNSDNIKNDVRDWVRERYEIPTTNFDDILQHTPIGMMYLYDIALGSDKKTIGRHTRHMVVTQGLTLGTMLITKGIFNARRPNGGSHAFPSGHTAYSFASASVIYHSFKNEHPLIAYSGYIPAVIVGSYRMIKDKHWISDVLFGAGMGILFSHLSYHLDIWHSRTDKDMLQKGPVISLGMVNSGVGLSVQF